jgi:hypothetical protein
MLVIRYDTNDGGIYYERAGDDLSAEDLRLHADQVKAKATERGTEVVNVRFVGMSEDEYNALYATYDSYEFFGKGERD